MHLDNDTCIEKRVAREILSIIENICFSDEFKEYRVNQQRSCSSGEVENLTIQYAQNWSILGSKSGLKWT